MPNDLISEALLDAIAQQESRNNPNAIGDTALENKAYGAFQMRLPALQDVQRRRKQYTTTKLEDILGDAKTQRELARLYLDVLMNDYGLTTLERLVTGYNAGPTAVRRGKVPARSIQYMKDVKARLGQP